MDTVTRPLLSPATLRLAFAFACVYIVWGTTYAGVAVAIRTMPPFVMGTIRFAIAGLLLFAYLRLVHGERLRDLPWRTALPVGALLNGISNGCVFWGQQGVPSGITALMVGSMPIWVLLLDALLFSRRPPRLRECAGMAIGLCGIGWIVAETTGFAAGAQPIYFAALALAAASWAFGSLIQRGAKTQGRLLSFACAQMLAGMAVQGVIALCLGEWSRFEPASVSAEGLWALAYLVVFGTLITLSCYLWLLARVATFKVATYTLVNPVVALAVGSIGLAEPLTGGVIGGCLLVLGGVALVMRAPAAPKTAVVAPPKPPEVALQAPKLQQLAG